MTPYKVLWLEDEVKKMDAFFDLALLENIELDHVYCVNDFKEKITQNYKSYYAAILDAKGVIKDLNEKPTLKAVSEAINYLNQYKDKKIIPYFILSGQLGKDENRSAMELLGVENIYIKSVHEASLLADLKRAADKLPDTQILHEYRRVFEMCTENYLGDNSALTLLNAIKNAEKDTFEDSKDYFLGLRKLLELLFSKLNAIGLIPDEIYKTPGWFNPSSDFLTGKQNTYQIKTDIIHPTISFLIRQLKELTQDAEHNINEKLKIKSDDFILQNKTPYLYRNAVYQMCDVLIWFKTFIDEHPNIEENKTFTIVKLVEDDGADWIIGEVYEIVYNGWGKFLSECGKIDLGIPKGMMNDFKISVNDKIKVQTNPTNKKYIDKIRHL